jgi:hypothetical protein
MRARAGWFVLWALAVLAVPVAIVLLLLAVDVLRTPGELTGDDRRFQAEPTEADGLWEVRGTTEELLGLEDDVAYRRLAAQYAAVEPGKVDPEQLPDLETARAEAQSEVARASEEEAHAARRARLLTMRGVLTLAEVPSTPEERRQLLEEAASIFRRAVDVDPSNVDAMTNLEAALSARPEQS